MKKDRWLAVTAGVGAPQFEEAAQRVYDDLQKSGIVDKVVKIITKDLPEVCPEVSRLYVDLMNVETRGYGYMCWKAEVVKAAVDGKWGDFDGVIWIDAGCEISINHLSSLMFNKFEAYARKHGVACFTLDTLEIEYTKRDLFEFFPEIMPTNSGKQIQSTWFFLYGNEGKKIAHEWFNAIMSGTHLLELTPSKQTEYPGFIENRYDQSAFSLVCKSNHVTVMNYSPTAGWGSFFSYIKGHYHPIWTSRNRFGQSKKKLTHKLLESLFRA